MTTITLHMEDEKKHELQQRAKDLGLSFENFLKLVFDDVLSRPDENFKQAMSYTLKKNEELYKRLAK